MESEKSLGYLRAKKKVETLKGFYSHLVVYVLVNTALILVSANVFNDKPIDFSHWSNYLTAFFWGIGLVSHAIYVFFVMNVENNFLKRWEEKKIREILEEDN
ncbi:2TM domain-containing protein [Aequorivita capsosiphonis]|uniref:2TM domain-containing protein n=1 Tax=Aequorivita capsosiphonis TaxID=487317 RepID=UPI000419EE75|nr:2TM domain-containing protein [Aequorivita capsosiphonis]